MDDNNQQTTDNNRKWYNRLEVYGAAAIAGKLLTLFPDYTVAHQLGDWATWSVGVAIGFGIIKGIKSDNLPSGLSKVVKPIVSPLLKKKNG